MALDLPITVLVIILPYAFSLIVLNIVRRTEIYCREPWTWVFSAFKLN
jgi:hypothetical protein